MNVVWKVCVQQFINGYIFHSYFNDTNQKLRHKRSLKIVRIRLKNGESISLLFTRNPDAISREQDAKKLTHITHIHSV